MKQLKKLLDRIPHMDAVNKDYEWADKIPYVSWPAGWKVKAIPPIVGAVIRYRVINSNGAKVSIYLDCYDALGSIGGDPYWEIYPNNDGDTERFDFEDMQGMLEAIGKCSPVLKLIPLEPKP